MDLYQANILDHYKNPHRQGSLKKPTHKADHGNALCGDTVKFQLIIKNHKVSDVRWTGEGCVLSQASSSILADELIGQTVAQINKWDNKKIIKLLKIEVGPNRINCAALPLETIKRALVD